MPRTITLTKATPTRVEINLAAEQIVMHRLLLDADGVHKDSDQIVYCLTLPENAPPHYRQLTGQQATAFQALLNRFRSEGEAV